MMRKKDTNICEIQKYSTYRFISFSSREAFSTNVYIGYSSLDNLKRIIYALEEVYRVGARLMRKTFKYRIYANKETEQTLLWTLNRCRELYNAALSERRD